MSLKGSLFLPISQFDSLLPVGRATKRRILMNRARVDKHIARVWLEDLEVECANAVLRDRIRVVVERALKGSLFLPISQFDSLLPVGRATKRRILMNRAICRVVVERAIETVAGLWADSSIHQDATLSGSANGQITKQMGKKVKLNHVDDGSFHYYTSTRDQA
jgi:hypothetical protein